MKRLAVAAAIGLFLMAVSLVPVAKPASAAVDIETGDYWKYEAGGSVEGMEATVTMKMKVTGTEGSGASEVYVIAITGSGDVSGTSGGITMSGGMDITGEITRLKSNFSLVSSSMDMIMTVKASGMTMKMTMGMEETYSPALDDYIGDDNPGNGGTIFSRSTVTTTISSKIEISGFPAETDSETTTDSVECTIVIAATNESVEVPAGTFDCYKYTETLEVGGMMSESLTYYYSDDVGNYVKEVGVSGDIMGSFGDNELTSYSHGSKGTTSSLFSGTNLMIIILIIVAVVVVVALVMVMRGRGKAPAQMMPPPYMGGPQPPPPPPPGS